MHFEVQVRNTGIKDNSGDDLENREAKEKNTYWKQ